MSVYMCVYVCVYVCVCVGVCVYVWVSMSGTGFNSYSSLLIIVK